MPRSRSKPLALPESRWKRWFFEPLLWIIGMIVMVVVSGTAVALASFLPFGPEMAAVIGYSAWMIVLLFYPGRDHPAYNPFSAAARRVWIPLLRHHTVALAVLIPAAALATFLHAKYAPRWLFAAGIVFLLVLSFMQYSRSADELEVLATAKRDKVR